MGRKMSEQERIDQINTKPNIRFIRWDGEFKGNTSKAVVRCDVDGYEWSTSVRSLVNNGTGCPQCAVKLKRTDEQENIKCINAKPNIKFVRWDGEFKGTRSKAVCRCAIDGYEWSSSVKSLTHQGSGCPQCAVKLKRTDEQENIKCINALPNIRFIRWDGEFKNRRTKAVCRCDVDGCEWSSVVDALVNNGTGCPQCAGNRKLTPDERIEQINALPNITFIRWDGEYRNKDSKAICRCAVDGYEWPTSVDSLVNKGTGCPYCARYGKTEEQPAPNVTVEIPTDVKPAFDLLNW